MIGYKYLFLSLFIVFGCAPKKERAQDCQTFNYNKNAVDALQDFTFTNDSTYLLRSLESYDNAIACDSSIINFLGKLTVLQNLGRLNESLRLIDFLYVRSGHRDIQMLVTKGVILERIGKIDSGKACYAAASWAYADALSKKPADSTRLIGEQLYLLAITNGKDVAIKRLEPYLKRFPDDPQYLTFQIMLRDFDRKLIIP